MEALKAAGSVIGGLAIFAALTFIGVVFIIGADTVSDKALPLFTMATVLATVFCVIILLPLSIFRATRIVSVWGFFIASYVFVVYTWMLSFLVTYSLWGAGGVFVGLCLVGIGILPLAIIAAAIHALWLTVADLLLCIVITYGTRMFAIYLAATLERAEAKEATRPFSFVKFASTSFVILLIVGVILTAAHKIMSFQASQDDDDHLSIAGASADKELNVTIDKDVHFTTESGWTIYLGGIIDVRAARRFEDFVTNNHVPPSALVVIDSPGGDLMQGLELGKSIRAHDFLTDVGRPNANPPLPFDYTAGECYSACTLAYIGGHFGFLKEGSRFGVHRFASLNPAQGDEDAAQITSATIVEYLKSMNIDTDFFSLSTQASPEEIFEPSLSVLQKLQVVNGGFEEPKWTIESNNGAIYLKGERDTIFGFNKFIVEYEERAKTSLLIIVDPQCHDKEIMLLRAHSLVIDDRDVVRVSQKSKEIVNGWFNVTYTLTNEQVQMIRRAKTVGVVFQSSYGAPIFLGFNNMPFADAAQKLDGILKLSGVQALGRRG
jgi:hypothetical protein